MSVHEENMILFKAMQRCLPKDIIDQVISFVHVESPEFIAFKTKALNAARKQKLLKLSRYTLNLRYDAFHVYSYKTCIADLDMNEKTIKLLGWWSQSSIKTDAEHQFLWSTTTSRHYNWTRDYLIKTFGFKCLDEKPRKKTTTT